MSQSNKNLPPSEPEESSYEQLLKSSVDHEIFKQINQNIDSNSISLSKLESFSNQQYLNNCNQTLLINKIANYHQYKIQTNIDNIAKMLHRDRVLIEQRCDLHTLQMIQDYEDLSESLRQQKIKFNRQHILKLQADQNATVNPSQTNPLSSQLAINDTCINNNSRRTKKYTKRVRNELKSKSIERSKAIREANTSSAKLEMRETSSSSPPIESTHFEPRPSNRKLSYKQYKQDLKTQATSQHAISIEDLNYYRALQEQKDLQLRNLQDIHEFSPLSELRENNYSNRISIPELKTQDSRQTRASLKSKNSKNSKNSSKQSQDTVKYMLKNPTSKQLISGTLNNMFVSDSSSKTKNSKNSSFGFTNISSDSAVKDLNFSINSHHLQSSSNGRIYPTPVPKDVKNIKPHEDQKTLKQLVDMSQLQQHLQNTKQYNYHSRRNG